MDEKPRPNINSITKAGLCTSCGSCFSICPTGAISYELRNFDYLFKAGNRLCTKCALCVKVCPGAETDYQALYMACFGQAQKNILLGNVLNAYIAHSLDETARAAASDGAAVTGILSYALKTGVINGALVTKMDEDNPLMPKTYVAENEQELYASAGSKYCPVPLNTAIKGLLNEKGKFAVVGLPCHIVGLRKMEQVNKKITEKIVLKLALFCDHYPTFEATHRSLQSLGVSPGRVKNFRYRAQNWFGDTVIMLNDGSLVSAPMGKHYLVYYKAFTNLCCTTCNDASGELSDISFGSAFPVEGVKGSLGKSTVVLARNEFADNLIKQAAADKIIKLSEVRADKIVQSKKAFFIKKKRQVGARKHILRLFNKAVRLDTNNLMPFKFGDYCLSLYYYIKLHLTKHILRNKFSRELYECAKKFKRTITNLFL